MPDDPSSPNPHHQHSAGHSMTPTRGAARPQMDMNMEKGAEEEDSKPYHEMDRHKMLHKHYEQTLWVYWCLIILGIWLITAPLTFSYSKELVAPAGNRTVWISLYDRILVLKWSDIISGALLILFGWRSLTPNRPVSIWICAVIGVWLNMAPVIFWAPSSFIYMNDTLIGVLVISLSILIPGMPNMVMYMKMGSEVPPGWSYNPSSWAQRWIMMVTGLMGWFVSRYLAAYQLGYIDSMWDPFFGNSSVNVLTSDLSRSLPVSDAALGSLAYTFEFLMGWMGGPSRWRTMPWMVTFFGILVIPLGLVHIVLVISQPLTVGAWCTFCLLAAGIMLPMIPLEIDEVVAMIQHLIQARRKGESFWPVFWKGGTPQEQNEDSRTPPVVSMSGSFGKVFLSSLWGMSIPWTLGLSSFIGIFLMTLPSLFDIDINAPLADLNHLCGAQIIVVAVICMGEVVRSGRFINIILGLALAVATWFMGDGYLLFKIINTVAGTAVIFLSIPRGIIKEKYGSWNSHIV